MKTKFLTLLLLLSAAVVSAETMRVAILEPVDRENKVNYGTKLILRSNLAKAVTNTAGYEAYDRSDMDAIMGEQNFQRTGMVSEDQIKRLGEMTGAKYILVAEAAVIDAQNMFITAKVLDVETARTVMTDNIMMGMDAKKIQDGCATLAGNLFHSTRPSGTSVQTNTSEVVAPVEAKVFEYEEDPNYLKVKKMRDAGAVLTGCGILPISLPLLIAGQTDMKKIAEQGSELYNNPQYTKAKKMRDAGAVLTGCGVLPISVPLLAIGQSQMKKIEKKMNKQK